MSNQQDDDFIDDDLDGVFSGHEDIPDAVEESVDDISDYDDSDEGIFAPAPEKKKQSSSLLLSTVAVVALLGAGGFYVYKNPGIIEQFTGGAGDVVAEAPQESVPEQVAEAPVAPEPQAVEPIQDSELTAIPQPQPIVNTTDADEVASGETTSAPADTATTDDIPATPDPAAVAEPEIANADSDAAPAIETPAPAAEAVDPASVPAETSAPVAETAPAPVAEEQPAVVVSAPEAPAAITPAPAMPEPPTPSEAAAEAIAPVPSATPEPVVAQTPAAPVMETEAVAAASSPVEQPKAPEVVETPAPKEEVLAQSSVPTPAPEALEPAPKKEQPVKAETPKVTKPVKAPETVYFDAPGSKAMTDIPTPSMDAKRGKNESIILVQNAITAENQESSVVAASRALRLGRYDAALDMFNDLYKANPRDSRILMGRAVTLQKLGRTTDAIRAYEEALDVDENNTEAVINLMGLVRKEYPAVALEKLLALKARHPENPGIIAQLGVAYADAGNLEDAAKYLGMASRMEPKNPQHFFNLGVIAERMKNRPHAIAYYEKALEIDAVYGSGRGIDRDKIYDRLARLRG